MSAVVTDGATMIEVDQVRQTANGLLHPKRKAELGQFMTPAPIAQFMASLFSERRGAVRLLDAGAGVGSLTAAFIERWGADHIHATAYEIDATMKGYLRETLARYGHLSFEGTVIERDFIQDAVYSIKLGKVGEGFTHAILNPPYKKINSDSTHRALLRAVGLETVNLYTAFVGLTIALMAQGGEVVAIIPRSFCNGLYYKPFREWLLARASLEHIHLFHSRTSAFNDDAVLQENVIIKLVRGKQKGTVTITTSSDKGFSDLQSNAYPFTQIVHEGDPQQFIHVPTAPTHGGLNGVPLARFSLDDIGLAVSTGPVVDFRLKEFLRAEPVRGAVPLLYPTHFSGGGLEWPRASKKPNALMDVPETRKWLYPNGHYTVVRRFSSKEERRRIVAHVVEPQAFEASALGFENHLNVFHSQKHGIDPEIAYGLSTFLNSTAVDEYFRRFSGHTQVNATDLRLLLYPALGELKQLGQWAQQAERLTQEQIDEKVEAMNGRRKQDR
ncbi:Eco57I restriction-modification methylase domain-containing protein [Oscillatoria amoena NRMC-F 0135]|nr:Eco57I restriction-modification methylase domain-containing protein [Oscillatoria amoena NRMC-F 0135]